MKLLIIFTVILSAAIAKEVETDAEKFECVANYLRDKKLLDKTFKYFVQSEELNCAPIITELRETLLLNTLDTTKSASSSEESEDSKEAGQLIKDNSVCIREQLETINFPEIMMKLFVYEKSVKTSKKQKKKLISATNTEAENKLQIAVSMCVSEPVFGEMFDNIMKDDVEEEDTLDEKQNDYCIRKYVVDKELVDINQFTINLNPDNIELNFECEDRIEDMFESLEEVIKDSFETANQSKKQLRCMNKALRTGKAGEYIAKISVLSEVKLTDDQKKEFRSEFVEKLKAYYQEMIKCL
ncbi:hypothetical protein ACKWTF_003794 [Chironomus riparius]